MEVELKWNIIFINWVITSTFPPTHHRDVLLAAEGVEGLLHTDLAPVGPRGRVPGHQDHQAVRPNV